jgi:hypothetical protein
LSTAITYTMDLSVPCSLTDAEYSSQVLTEWTTLLDASGVTEKDIQQFLEKNPCLLPFKEMPLNQGNGSALSSAVVTQPKLPGLKTKVPDFLYFTGNSAEITAIFIEIESPEKKWFTNGGQPTAELTQAANQITSWKTWFEDPTNRLAFERDYLVRDYPPLNNRILRQEYILVIGRREEINDPNLMRSRSNLQRENETWMTYDRLTVSHHFFDAVTVRLDCSGISPVFRVCCVPPILKLGPHHYPNYHHLVGLQDAINANPEISTQRKQFLVSRLGYWSNLHKSKKGLVVTSGADFRGE